MTIYTYSLYTYFQTGLNLDILHLDILDNPALEALLVSVTLPNTDVLIEFSSSLDAQQEADLNTIVVNHNPSSRVIDDFVVLADVRASGTNGGAFPSGSWVTRTLAKVQGENVRLWATVASNQITLIEGTYFTGANCSVGEVGVQQLRLAREDGSTVPVLYGTTSSGKSAIVQGRLVVPYGGGVYELQHRCSVQNLTDGLGQAGSFGTSEIYATMRITRA